MQQGGRIWAAPGHRRPSAGGVAPRAAPVRFRARAPALCCRPAWHRSTCPCQRSPWPRAGGTLKQADATVSGGEPGGAQRPGPKHELRARCMFYLGVGAVASNGHLSVVQGFTVAQQHNVRRGAVVVKGRLIGIQAWRREARRSQAGRQRGAREERGQRRAARQWSCSCKLQRRDGSCRGGKQRTDGLGVALDRVAVLLGLVELVALLLCLHGRTAAAAAAVAQGSAAAGGGRQEGNSGRERGGGRPSEEGLKPVSYTKKEAAGNATDASSGGAHADGSSRRRAPLASPQPERRRERERARARGENAEEREDEEVRRLFLPALCLVPCALCLLCLVPPPVLTLWGRLRAPRPPRRPSRCRRRRRRPFPC